MRIMEVDNAHGIPATSGRELLTCLVRGMHLLAVVPITLAIVERDPLVSGGSFRGDLMRGLMEVPGGFWGRHPRLYQRYVHALRASAAARRNLPRADRMEFWSPLDVAPIDNEFGEPDPESAS